MNEKKYISTRTYLTKKEQESVDKFFEQKPILDAEYKSGNKTLKALKFDYPIGCWTPESMVLDTDENDGTMIYITPHSNINETKKVRVWVFDGQKHSIITGDEWLKFVFSKDSEVKLPPPKKKGKASGKSHEDIEKDLKDAERKGEFDRPVDFMPESTKVKVDEKK